MSLLLAWLSQIPCWAGGLAGLARRSCGLGQQHTLAPHLRNEAVSLYSLCLNMGTGVGVACAVIVLAQGVQVNHEVLSSNISYFHSLFQDHLLPQAWSFSHMKGLGAVDRVVLQQATAIAFNNAFHLIMIVALGMIPFIALLTAPKRSRKSGAA